jgi:uncharacterized protein YjbI with pentapeptide repeats
MDNYYTKYLKYKNKYIELKGIKGASINNVVRGEGDDGIYYSKYMKYKTKYITEKGLVGGELTPCKDVGNLKSIFKSVWWYIRETDCNYKALLEKIGDKVNAITYDDFSRTNSGHTNDKKITIQHLKDREFTALFLKEKGFPLKELKDAEFNALQLKVAGFPLNELKDAGFNATELKNVWFSAGDLYKAGFTLEELINANFSAANLYYAGFTLQELKSRGFSAGDLYYDKFNASQIKDAGFSAKDLYHNWFNASQLKNAKFSATELRDAEFTLQELINAKFSATELKDAKFSATELTNAGFNVSQLKDAGFSAGELRNAKFTLQQLKNAEFSALDLKNAEFSATELRDAKFTLQQLTNAGFSATELKVARFNASQLQNAGFHSDALQIAGFSNEDIINAGFTLNELKAIGINTEDIEKQLIEKELNALELRNYGFTIEILKNKGYSAFELICAGYTPEELKQVGYNQVDIDKATYLKHNRFTVKQLTGYTQDELTGYTREQLIDAGYISILKDGKTVYPSAYIDDTLLLLRPRVLASLFETKDKRILIFNHYNDAYLYFYSKLKEYVYQNYGNEENMNNVKTNWKISLYGCHKSDPRERHSFDVSRFNFNGEQRILPKPFGIYGSELSNESSWIEYVLDKDYDKLTGHPGNCSGFLIFRLKDDNKILHILNEEDLKKLKPYFKMNFEDFKFYDWKAIAQKYHALNLQLILNLWDVLTTVVWNKEAVAEFHFITLRDLPFVRNFVNYEMLFLPNDKS